MQIITNFKDAICAVPVSIWERVKLKLELLLKNFYREI